MKHLSSFAKRISMVALAAQMVIAGCVPTAFAQEAAAPRRGEPITLNFTNADIESVARTMAVVTGRDVVVDPRVKGTITLQTDRPISPTAAFDQFASVLRLQGFAVVQSEGLYKIVPEADAKLQSSTVTTSTPATATLSGSQIVTQVFKLNYESANSLLPVLRPLIAPNNTINVNPGNNSLVITDYAENMRRLARIVAALDVPNASDLEVISLKHSVATDLVPLVTRLLEGGSGTGPGAAVAPGTVDASFRTTLLAEPRSNAIIVRAANPARLQLVHTLIDKLDRAPIDNGNGAAGNIYVVYLKNSDAVRLATTLRAAMSSEARGAAGGSGGGGASTSLQSNLSTQPIAQANATQSGMSQSSSAASTPLNNANQPSTGGQIQADPQTNSLIITAPEPQYRQIRAVIDKLDGRRAQVMVESLIVEVNADKAADFGIQWQSALGGSGQNVGVIGTNSSLGGANIIDLAVGLATGNPATRPSSGFNFGIGHKVNGQYVLGFLARFLQSSGEGNVLSTPNLLTLDNEEAKIVVGQNVPFVTGQYTNTGSTTNTVSPFQTIERKDVGLTLRVRPQISEDGTVKMSIFQEVSSVVASTVNNPNGPTTSKRSIESNVVVDDGSIVVLGGLLSDEYSRSDEKVPGLGDVPILGNLFKSETRSRTKSNLMVFLRPVVIRDNASGEAVANERYEAIRAMQQSLQPATDNPMLRGVNEAPVLPPFPFAPVPPAPPQNAGSNRRFEGTQLIPPPAPSPQPALGSSSLKGALPPTADPSTKQELP
jgi:general secretion pathway protein D